MAVGKELRDLRDTSPKSDIDLLLVFDTKEEARRQETRMAEILTRARVKRIIVPTCMGVEELRGSPDLTFNVMRDGCYGPSGF